MTFMALARCGLSRVTLNMPGSRDELERQIYKTRRLSNLRGSMAGGFRSAFEFLGCWTTPRLIRAVSRTDLSYRLEGLGAVLLPRSGCPWPQCIPGLDRGKTANGDF